MQFGLAYNYFLNRKGGFNNLLLLTVCELIPVVGPIVSLGYRAEVADALDRDPDVYRHPRFDFNNFVRYLERGVWPFLTALVLGLATMLPGALAFFLGMMVGAAAQQPIVGLALGGCLYAAAILAYILLVVPMMLHAELTARFDLPGAWRFSKRFLGLVGGRMVLTGLIYTPISFIVVFVGLLACFVGVYPASALNQMAAQHLMIQLYHEYLDRGGDPIVEDEPDDEPDDEPEEPDYAADKL